MRCEDARPLISAELDGELHDPRAAELCRHLAECMLCHAERVALVGTVRLLQTVPEAEPPVELRRRIGVALLEEERRAQRRHLGWSWLARPRAAGWAWGAAFGAIVATAALVITHGGVRPTPVAQSRPLVPLSTSKIASRVSAPPAVGSLGEYKSAVAPPKQPDRAVLKLDLPHLTAVVPPKETLSALPPPSPSVRVSSDHMKLVAPTVAPRRHRHAVTRSTPPIPAVSPATHGSPPRVEKSSPRPMSSDPEAPRTVRMDPQSSTDTQAAPPSDSDDSSDTSSMTQMASSPMTSPPVETKDDLAELRHRLTDRPLQVPELGQLKPASTSGAKRDGWIRF